MILRNVLVAMSGGVDSAVAVIRSLERGLHTEGLYLKLTDEAPGLGAAMRIAQKLGIKLHVIDAVNKFNAGVIEYFRASYLAGLTPNPCIICNPRIKIAIGLELADQLGCGILATGHYARVYDAGDGETALLKGTDPAKDQSYFLHQIPRDALNRLWFPDGPLTKTEVKRIACSAGLLDIIHKESQEICFFRGDYRAFFRPDRRSPCIDGEIATKEGRVIGRHSGLYAYTIGQRHGLGLCGAAPYYVTAIDPDKNRLIVGKNEDLYAKGCLVDHVNWLTRDPGMAIGSPVTVKIRYRHQGVRAGLELAEGKGLKVTFESPQRAVTPGQFAVFYQTDMVLGGGRICA